MIPIREIYKHTISIKKRFYTKNIVLNYKEATAIEFEEYIKRIETWSNFEFYQEIFFKNKVSKKDFQYLFFNWQFWDFEKDFLKNYLWIWNQNNSKVIDKDKIELSFAEMFWFLAWKWFDIYQLASEYTYKQIKYMYKVAFYSDELTKYNELDKKTKNDNFSFLNSLQDFVLSNNKEEEIKEETNFQKNWKMRF